VHSAREAANGGLHTFDDIGGGLKGLAIFERIGGILLSEIQA
jgi:hypothetical protein